MKILGVLAVIALLAFAVCNVSGRKHKWLKKPWKKDHGRIKDVDEGPKKSHHHHGDYRQHKGPQKTPRRLLNFKKTDSLPYSSKYSRPYDWNMYTDGPYGWGPSKKRREINSFNKFKRSLYPQNYAPQYSNQQQAVPGQPTQQFANYQPAQPAQPAQQPYSYQAAASRNTLVQSGTGYTPQSRPVQKLQKKAPEVQQPQERTWVDKLGVKWTTKKVNDYKWGEREPGITMDEYAGGPFGFDDVKRSQIARRNQQWQRRSSIPRPSSNGQPRSWVDKHGVKWTMDHVNDYKWGEREPGVSMDEYNGGPYGWTDVKRNRIPLRNSKTTTRNMYMDKP